MPLFMLYTLPFFSPLLLTVTKLNASPVTTGPLNIFSPARWIEYSLIPELTLKTLIVSLSATAEKPELAAILLFIFMWF